jgi:hypothetical protein
MLAEHIDRGRFWAPYIHALVGAFLLAMVAIWNGYPLLYEDTEAYISRPATALASHGPSWLASDWTSAERVAHSDSSQKISSPSGAEEEQDDGWVAGRSVYWGMLAYMLILVFGVWGIVALNALSAALVLALFWFRALGQSALRFYFTVAVLATCSYAPLFVALLMPDILAAVAIAAMALLIATWTELRVLDRWALLFLCGLGAVSHDSIILIAAGLAALAALNRIFSGPAGWLKSWRQAAAIFTPIFAGLLALVLFNWMAVIQTGQPPLRYPFLSAHLSSLESGQRHLQEACPESGYALCYYQDRLPVPWTDFIFSRSDEAGIFATAAHERKRQLSDEQYEFAIAVAVDQPALLSAELVDETLVQLLSFDLNDLRQSGKQKYFERNFPASILDKAKRSEMWNGTKWLQHFEYLQSFTALLGLAALILAGGLRMMGWVSAPAKFWSIALLILGGIIINAAVCGILASPWGRFQARVVWLITLLGVTVLATMRIPRMQSEALNQDRGEIHAVGNS